MSFCALCCMSTVLGTGTLGQSCILCDHGFSSFLTSIVVQLLVFMYMAEIVVVIFMFACIDSLEYRLL
jgi:hypothetical protein